jgi:hypothetical protein
MKLIYMAAFFLCFLANFSKVYAFDIPKISLEEKVKQSTMVVIGRVSAINKAIDAVKMSRGQKWDRLLTTKWVM